MLGVEGVQIGLLGQLDCFDGCGWASVAGLEVLHQLITADLDELASGRPPFVQGRWDTDDLPDRSFAWVAMSAWGKLQAQGTQVLF